MFFLFWKDFGVNRLTVPALFFLEIDPQGKILGVSTLPKSLHKQPEGLAIATDGTIYIANEGQGKTAKLVIYRLRK